MKQQRLGLAIFFLLVTATTPASAWPVPRKSMDRILLGAADVIAIVEPIAVCTDGPAESIAIPGIHEGQLAGVITTFHVVAVIKGYQLVGAWDWQDKKTIDVSHFRRIGNADLDRLFLPDFTDVVVDPERAGDGTSEYQYMILS